MAAKGFGAVRPSAWCLCPVGDLTAARTLSVEPPLQPGPAVPVGGAIAGARADWADVRVDVDREERRERIRFVQGIRARRRRSRRRTTRVL
jgi:hypothetical protein